jgi:Tol biopolymer transport system component
MQAVNSFNAFDETGQGQFSVSSNGTLVYLAGGIYQGPKATPVWVDRTGVAVPLGVPPGSFLRPRISPTDGERIAFTQRLAQTFNQSDVWVYDVRRQNSVPLTRDGDGRGTVWSPDGKSVVFNSKRSLFRISADGSGMPERLTTSDFPQTPAAWSAANNMLAFLEEHDTGYQIWVRPMVGDSKPKLFLKSQFPLAHPDFSPDGRWITYVSRESGGMEVWVQPYPGPGERIRITTGDGTPETGSGSPAWARSGRELFYIRGAEPHTQLWVVDIDTTKGFSFSKPRRLFEGNYYVIGPTRGYDVSPDGQRFLMPQAPDPEAPFTQMHIVLNWTEELKRRAPTRS